MGTAASLGVRQAVINSSRAWSIWGLGVLFYFYEFMLQTSTGVMVSDLMGAFNATGEEMGQLSAAYLYSYALMQIPAGIFMDRIGPRRLFSAASLFCALGCFIFAYAPTLVVAITGRVLMGVGASFAVVGCLKIASLWFPPTRFALLAGLTVAIGMLGAAGGQAPMAVLVKYLGWRETLLYGAVLGLVLSLVLWRAMKPAPGVQEVSLHETNHLPLVKALKTIMADTQTWIASLYAGLMFVPTVGFAGLWGVPYLIQAYGLSRPEAALYISLIYVGWAVGGPIFGWYSDSIAQRRKPMVIATIGTLITMTAIWMLPNSLLVMAALLLLLGAFSSGFVLAFSVVRESHLEQLTGTAMGFVNTLNSLSGAISQPILGLILDRFWIEGTYVDGARSYSLEAYHSALFSIPVCLIVALVMLPLIKETHCKARLG